MYLKRLHIKNFRCFSSYEIEFAPRVTVLFGKNGSGKSTLIHAIHKAMSMFMHSEKIKAKDPKTKKMKPIGEMSIRSGNPYLNVEGFSLMGDQNAPYVKPATYMIDISAEALLDNDTEIDWAMNVYAINCRLRTSEYKDAFSILCNWHKRTGKLPLLAYFSDGYPHFVVNGKTTGKDKSKEAFHVKSDMPEVGYTDWNSEKGFTNTWIQRLSRKLTAINMIPMEINILEKQHEEGVIDDENYSAQMAELNSELTACQSEVNAIRSCLQSFSKGDEAYEISNIALGRYRRANVFVVTTSGQRTELNELPAGYKRMLFMALDIAYRSYLLSGMKTTDVEGLVIIDEIDLHLHPELEQRILERFMRTFTKAQFVVSTHSPAVLSNLLQNNDNRIVQMFSDGDDYSNVKMENVYGLDYNNTVSLVMGAQDRDPHVQTVKDRYVRLMRRGKRDKAELAVKEIKRLFPNEYKKVIEELNAKVR